MLVVPVMDQAPFVGVVAGLAGVGSAGIAASGTGHHTKNVPHLFGHL